MNRVLCLCLLLIGFNAYAADTYRIDADHTRVSFDVDPMGIPWIEARFSDLAGEFVVDRDGPESHIDVTVETNSIDGLDPAMNERVRSRQWLDSRRYPEMIFRSRYVEFEGDHRATAYGQLTLHGITKSVSLDVSQLDCTSGASDSRRSCGFIASAQISRSDFGLPHGFWLAGDRVRISITGTGIP